MEIDTLNQVQWQLDGEHAGFYQVGYTDKSGDYHMEERDLLHVGEHRLGAIHNTEENVVFCAKCQAQYEIPPGPNQAIETKRAFGHFYYYSDCHHKVQDPTGSFKSSEC